MPAVNLHDTLAASSAGTTSRVVYHLRVREASVLVQATKGAQHRDLDVLDLHVREAMPSDAVLMHRAYRYTASLHPGSEVH
jgi:hypothetical protein